MGKMWGTLLPLIAPVIIPCNQDGDLISGDEDEKAAHFERSAWVFAWFGFYLAVPSGEIAPRMIDPKNPRRYAPGNF